MSYPLNDEGFYNTRSSKGAAIAGSKYHTNSKSQSIREVSVKGVPSAPLQASDRGENLLKAQDRCPQYGAQEEC